MGQNFFLLEYGNCRDLTHVPMSMQCFIHVKVNFEKIIRFLYLYIFRSIIYQVVANGRLKTKKNFKILALKVFAVAYERCSLTRGSKYSDLTWELLVFRKTGR